MNILLVGSGGREHALAWKIHQSPRLTRLFIAPGNGGTAALGENIAIQDNDIVGLTTFARQNNIDLVVTGPELPLVLGLNEELAKIGVPCFGPDAFAAQLEGSKAFAKTLMRETGIPTADFRIFENHDEALTYARGHALPMVIKADGLAAGKGVVIAQTLAEAEKALDDMMRENVFGDAGKKVLIEEALIGEEASFLAFCDGDVIVPLPSAQDHKRIGDGDTGPNTGGMGAYSPAPVLPENRLAEMAELTMRPLIRRLRELGHPFRGVLYAGLMMTKSGPMVLEYNVRFGDPECQPLVMRLSSDLVDIMQACCEKRLKPEMVRFSERASCCVVMAAKGYPQKYPKGMTITGIDDAERLQDVTVFHAGARREGDSIVSSGGRVLGVTARGDTLAQARDLAYQAVEKIHFENSYYRTDIAAKGLRRK